MYVPIAVTNDGKKYIYNIDVRSLKYFTSFFIILASPKKKKNKTNEQKNRKNVGRDTATAVANNSGPEY